MIRPTKSHFQFLSWMRNWCLGLLGSGKKWTNKLQQLLFDAWAIKTEIDKIAGFLSLLLPSSGPKVIEQRKRRWLSRFAHYRSSVDFVNRPKKRRALFAQLQQSGAQSVMLGSLFNQDDSRSKRGLKKISTFPRIKKRASSRRLKITLLRDWYWALGAKVMQFWVSTLFLVQSRGRQEEGGRGEKCNEDVPEREALPPTLWELQSQRQARSFCAFAATLCIRFSNCNQPPLSIRQISFLATWSSWQSDFTICVSWKLGLGGSWNDPCGYFQLMCASASLSCLLQSLWKLFWFLPGGDFVIFFLAFCMKTPALTKQQTFRFPVPSWL